MCVISFFYRLSVPFSRHAQTSTNETRQTHSQGHRVFSACVQRAKRTKRKKRKDVHNFCRRNGCKNIKFISEGNTAYSYMQEERMHIIIKSISEGNTAYSYMQEERMHIIIKSISEGNTLLCLLLINYFLK